MNVCGPIRLGKKKKDVTCGLVERSQCVWADVVASSSTPEKGGRNFRYICFLGSLVVVSFNWLKEVT